jgi:predicted transcriptional regulator
MARASGREPDRPAADRDGPATRQFTERLAAGLMEAGFPRMPARVFAALLTSDSNRLTADQLAGLLRVSPAAVSGAVRYLGQFGMVSREAEPGSRRHQYRVPDHVWTEVVRLRDRVMARWAALFREGAEVVGADSPAGARLAASAEFFDFVTGQVTSLLDSWDERSAGAGRGPGAGQQR